MYFSLFNFCFYQIISILSLFQAWLYLANHLGSWEGGGGPPGIYNTSPKTKPGKKKFFFFYLMIISSNTQTKKTYIHNYLLVWLHMLVLWLMKLCKPYDLSKWTKDLRNVNWHIYSFAFTWKAVMTLDQLFIKYWYSLSR